MVGEFLEFSVAAQPLSTSYEFYGALGFVSLPVGDALTHPYVVLFDGNVAMGLHDRDQPDVSLTFVRPKLADYARGLRRLGVQLESSHLADNEFNRLSFLDPSGQSITLLEARTFPPGEWNPQNVAACGRFLEYSLPTSALAQSQSFWQALGFTTVARGDAPHAWVRLEGHGLVVGLHEAHFRAGLSFRSAHLEARLEYLQARGIGARPGTPIADRAQASATLTAPEGTSIYLFEAGSQQ